MIGGKKFLASREGAAEAVQGGNSAAPERSAGAKRRRFISGFFFWICVSDLVK